MDFGSTSSQEKKSAKFEEETNPSDFLRQHAGQTTNQVREHVKGEGLKVLAIADAKALTFLHV